MLLSILIPTIQRHRTKFSELALLLSRQIVEGVEVVFDTDEHLTTGAKRNELLKSAKGKYVAFVDSDDLVPSYYVSEILKAIESEADCFAINGTISTNGKNVRNWYISKDLPYKESEVNGQKVYLRYPNHITPMKREIALRVKFPDKTHGEDYDWATELHNLNLIKTEYKIEKPMYFYQVLRVKSGRILM